MPHDLSNAEEVFKLMNLGFSYTQAVDLRAQDAKTFIGFGIHLGWRPSRATDKTAAPKSDMGQTES